jgi:hypothetical protein
MKVNSINSSPSFKSPLTKFATKMGDLKLPETKSADTGAKMFGAKVATRSSSAFSNIAPMQYLEAGISLFATGIAYILNGKFIDKAVAKNWLGEFCNPKNGIITVERLKVLKERSIIAVLLGAIPISSAIVRKLMSRTIAL